MSFPSVRGDPCHADLKARCAAPKQRKGYMQRFWFSTTRPGWLCDLRAPDSEQTPRLSVDWVLNFATRAPPWRTCVARRLEREPRTLQRASGHRIRADAASGDGASRHE